MATAALLTFIGGFVVGGGFGLGLGVAWANWRGGWYDAERQRIRAEFDAALARIKRGDR